MKDFIKEMKQKYTNLKKTSENIIQTTNKKIITANKKKKRKTKRKTKRIKTKKNKLKKNNQKKNNQKKNNQKKILQLGGMTDENFQYREKLITELRIIYIFNVVDLISRNFIFELPRSVNNINNILHTKANMLGLVFPIDCRDIDIKYLISTQIMQFIETEINIGNDTPGTLPDDKRLPRIGEIYDYGSVNKSINMSLKILKWLSEIINNFTSSHWQKHTRDGVSFYFNIRNNTSSPNLPGGESLNFIDYILNYTEQDENLKRMLCNTPWNILSEADCPRQGRRNIVLDGNLLIHDIFDLIAWYFWTGPIGVYTMINAFSRNSPEFGPPINLNDSYSFPIIKDRLDDITVSQDYQGDLWRGEFSQSQATNWLNTIYQHPNWVENNCDGTDEFNTFMIHQKHFTSTTDDLQVAKNFAKINSQRGIHTLFKIAGNVRINNETIEYVNDIKTNKNGYQNLSWYSTENEYLLKPGLFFIRCPDEEAVENILQNGNNHAHKIIKVYHFPFEKISDLILAFMYKVIDKHNEQGNLNDRTIRLMKDDCKRHFNGNKDEIIREFNDFINLVNGGSYQQWRTNVNQRFHLNDDATDTNINIFQVLTGLFVVYSTASGLGLI